MGRVVGHIHACQWLLQVEVCGEVQVARSWCSLLYWSHLLHAMQVTVPCFTAVSVWQAWLL